MRSRRPPARPPHPPHPAARQWARSPADLPDVVLCTGTAEHYEDNVHADLKLVLVPDAPFEVRRRGVSYPAPAGRLLALHADEAHSGGPGRPPSDVGKARSPEHDVVGPGSGRPGEAAVAGSYGVRRPGGDAAAAMGPEGAGDPGWLLMCLSPGTLADAGVSGRITFAEPVLVDPDVAARYRQVHDFVEGPAPALARAMALGELIGTLARRAGASIAPDSATGTSTGVAVARDLLGDHLDRNVTLAELATVAALSPYEVVRAFRHRYGLPPHALHLRLRLDRAQDLLRRGERATDVAHATGFADQAHFTRRFKRLYGVTPREYQQSSRGGRGRDRSPAPGPGPADVSEPGHPRCP